MARGSQDIVKKNSKLESFLQRSLTGETFDRIRGYESCVCVSEKENKAFKYVIFSDEWVYLTENPPKSIRGVVHFRDVVNVELINDYPEFLSGEEQRNTQHIAITHVTSEPQRRRSLRRPRYRSPRGSVVDLQTGDRSNNSTPLGYASSVDGSEDAGYFTQSASSLPRSRPTSRGSVGSQREGRPNLSKKKKKAPTISETWESDSILRSLKEEIEEEVLEDIEEDSLSVVRAGHATNLQSSFSLENGRGSRSQSHHSGPSSLNNSRTSVRPLPPHPKTGAFETVAPQPEVKSDSAGIVVSPQKRTTRKALCLCFPFWCCTTRSQVAPMTQPPPSKPEDFSGSKTQLSAGDTKSSIPSVAISTMSDDGRESCTSRRSSVVGGGGGSGVGVAGAGSRSGTPSLDMERLGSLPSELSGSTMALHNLSVAEGGGGGGGGAEQRQTVLHIYLLNSSSPILMLLRGAWNNYLIRATLSLDPSEESLDGSTILLSSKHQREKCELLFNQLKQQLFDPGNSIVTYFQLFTDLQRAAHRNFLMKKLFWRSGDIVGLMVQLLQKYMPRTEANLHTDDGREQRVDELEFVVLLVKTISIMFRESEVLGARMQALKTERGKHVADLLSTLTAALSVPEKQILLMKHWSAPLKNNRFGSNTTLNRDGELYQLLSEYTHVSNSAVFELFLMAKQNTLDPDEGFHFSVGWMVKVMEESQNTTQFVERVMSQVLEVINLARFGAVSCRQAVRLFQQFSLLLALLEHSAAVLPFLRNHYHEEFKYFIQGPALARKLPTHFPITPATVRVVSQVSAKVLGHPTPKGGLSPR
ncbi:uncharacterized protein C12orf56-like [Babylonia areolata]|uniref:uncharacterized protein C12orf56-like n=1 Tax=Babylonia areolata TaxID=304850 RepID=UPI003FD22594